MFKVNQKVVCPAHGVATIKRIEKRTINGEPREFYVLETFQHGTAILAQCDKAETVGLRQLISVEKAHQVLKSIEQWFVKSDNSTWNKRYTDYVEKLQTGDIDKIVYVFVALRQLSKTKSLSFGERKMLDRARILLKEELTEVMGSHAISEISVIYFKSEF